MRETHVDIAAKDMNYRSAGDGPTLQEIFDGDRIPPPAPFRETSEMELGTADLSIDRYTALEWHEAEVDKVWRRTWQVACREEQLSAVGDFVVYDIVDDSIIVVRTAPDEIRAYYNSCLHRGTALCLDHGHADTFRCPFHGFSWSLDGELTYIPSDWDFQHIPRDDFRLPEANVGTWGGFVFVNMDPTCSPLEDYLEILPDHLDIWRFEDKYIHAHVSMVVPCNWKVAQEAFIEGYHVAETHYPKDDDGNLALAGPAMTNDDVMIQYDVWPQSRHVTRLNMAAAVPSHHLANAGITEQDIVDAMLPHLPDEDRPTVGPHQKARQVLAEHNRASMGRMLGVDLSETPDTDVLDQCQYTLFPNFTFWPTVRGPLLYRFRPDGDSVDTSLMEVYVLRPIPTDGREWASAPEVRLETGASWTEVQELGSYGRVLDEDVPNMVRLTKGLKTSRKSGVTLANYQEVRIRHFHRTLEEYLSAD